MINSGLHIKTMKNGEIITARANSMEIIDELKMSIEYKDTYINHLEKELEEAKSETFKDETIKKLQEENKRLKDELYLGFPVTKEEYERVQDWIGKWKAKHHYTLKDAGSIGGGFTYKFIPTSIGTSGVVVAPNGDEFEFQEIS